MSLDTYGYYGELVDGGDIQIAVQKTIQKYVHSYLGEWERRKGHELNSTSRPFTYTFDNSEDFSAYEGTHLPAVLIICPGTVDEPMKHGRKIGSRWLIGVAVVTGGPDYDDVNRTSKGYGAVIRSLLVQHGGLNPDGGPSLTGGITWKSEAYDDFDLDDNRSMMATKLVFYVDIPNTASVNGAPPDDLLDPDDDAPNPTSPTPPVVTQTTVEVKPHDIDTEISVE